VSRRWRWAGWVGPGRARGREGGGPVAGSCERLDSAIVGQSEQLGGVLDRVGRVAAERHLNAERFDCGALKVRPAISPAKSRVRVKTWSRSYWKIAMGRRMTAGAVIVISDWTMSTPSSAAAGMKPLAPG
jgi:hypothetical protein